MSPGVAATTSEGVRPAAVAGLFYPDDGARLAVMVEQMLAQARDQQSGPVPKVLIVPHAGYVYSGQTAARAYARLAAGRGVIRRVVLLGPAHRVRLRGLALPEVRAFASPLGRVEVDASAVQALADLPQVHSLAAAHAAEHALEVQLPFLLAVLGQFTLVPLVVGDASPEEMAEVLERLWGGPETLIVISSDLSHYHAYREAMQSDARTVEAVLSGAGGLDHEQACGATPINGMLAVARRRGMRIELVDQCNSGDTAGDRQRVVGYASFAFYPRETAEIVVPQWFPADGGMRLLALARAAIGQALGVGAAPVLPREAESANEGAWLDRRAAVFVTLTRDGALRGCIGTLEAHRPLREDLAANAVAAALRDPRFPSVGAPELPLVRLEVSLLSDPVPMSCASEADALRQLVPHVDGVILASGNRRATFLPQVWEQLPEPAVFLAHLKAKAGLAPGFWSADGHDAVRLWRYSVSKFAE